MNGHEIESENDPYDLCSMYQPIGSGLNKFIHTSTSGHENLVYYRDA
jgi:hypothetical protein